TTGLVHSCRSLDCLSVFASSAADAETVWRLAQGPDPRDPYSRTIAPGADAAPWLPGPFRVGVPRRSQLEFFGDEDARGLFEAAVSRLETLGGSVLEIDFDVFRETSSLLYAGPWVAERFAAVGDFILANRDAVHPVVADIICGG